LRVMSLSSAVPISGLVATCGWTAADQQAITRQVCAVLAATHCVANAEQDCMGPAPLFEWRGRAIMAQLTKDLGLELAASEEARSLWWFSRAGQTATDAFSAPNPADAEDESFATPLTFSDCWVFVYLAVLLQEKPRLVSRYTSDESCVYAASLADPANLVTEPELRAYHAKLIAQGACAAALSFDRFAQVLRLTHDVLRRAVRCCPALAAATLFVSPATRRVTRWSGGSEHCEAAEGSSASSAGSAALGPRKG